MTDVVSQTGWQASSGRYDLLLQEQNDSLLVRIRLNPVVGVSAMSFRLDPDDEERLSYWLDARRNQRIAAQTEGVDDANLPPADRA